MRFMTSAVATLLLTAAAAGAAQTPSGAHAPPELKWGPAPAVFPPGAEMAVLQGDPSSKALFTVRLRMPDGYTFPPHWHPTDEHVTVISGTFKVGMGKTMDRTNMLSLSAGGFITAPARAPHYAVAVGRTVVQVHAMGPFALTYVNKADVPSGSGKR